MSRASQSTVRVAVNKVTIVGLVILLTFSALASAGDPLNSDKAAESAAKTVLKPKKWRNKHERALPGIWVSHDLSGGASAGRMELLSSGRAKLEPKIGSVILPAYEGMWEADGETLRIEVPEQGRAEIRYTLSKDRKHLYVEYSNGMFQRFYRPEAKKEPVLP